jgi:hypothetical protein
MNRDRLNELTTLDSTYSKDYERLSLFNLISNNDELWDLKHQIYDFEDHSIKPEILESGIASSSKKLIKIGFNLFNSHPTDSLIDCFTNLDDDNFDLVIQSIKIRFNRGGLE